MYSAYLRKAPVILAGSNGKEIACAFSAALFAQSPGVLNCEGSFSSQVLNEAEDSQSKIVIIENPFCREWYYHVIRLMSNREKFYIALHPFPEDLKLEPPSLINYCLPVLTEKLVDTYPRTEYITGRESDSFLKFPITSHSEQIYNKLLKRLRIPPLTKNVLWDILCDMQAMGSDHEQSVFLLYSLVYVSGRLEILREGMKDCEAAKMLRAFVGDEE